MKDQAPPPLPEENPPLPINTNKNGNQSHFISMLLLIVCTAAYFHFFNKQPTDTTSLPVPQETDNQQEKRKQTYDRVFDGINEKKLLRDSFFGDFKKGKKLKRAGSVNLKVWEPRLEWAKTLPPSGRAVVLEGVYNLNIKYDEVWKAEDVFDAPENKFKGEYDKYTLYWKSGMAQASTLEKFYLGDPSTGQPLYPPSHKIVNIYDREFILKKLSE